MDAWNKQNCRIIPWKSKSAQSIVESHCLVFIITVSGKHYGSRIIDIFWPELDDLNIKVMKFYDVDAVFYIAYDTLKTWYSHIEVIRTGHRYHII